jgi:hypothetical protein
MASGSLEIWGGKWDSYAKGTHPFQNLKYPPGVWMDLLPLTRRVWFGVAPNADPDQPRPWLAGPLGVYPNTACPVGRVRSP